MKGVLTIAIPTMKRWEFLKDTLPVFLARDEVAEVIVCDETGEDAAAIKVSEYNGNPKLRVVVNDRKLGIYENKRKVFGLAHKAIPWVALLDSDNYFNDEWFDRLFETIDLTNDKMIYASADFRHVDIHSGLVRYMCKDFSGVRLSKDSWNSVFDKKGWNFLLNDGNWVVPRGAYDMLPASVKSEHYMAADAIYMLRRCILGGYTIWYVPDLVYIHTQHMNSSWMLTEKESARILSINDWRI